MKHVTPSEFSAADYGCPAPKELSFAPIFRADILRAVRTARRHIGLTRTDLAVLDACLSYLPLKAANGAEQPAEAQMMLTVFASNQSICARVGGLDERCLRRSIANMITLGLLRRHDSATGKRYARRINGQIVEAYGIDLRPLFSKGRDLVDLAHDLERTDANRRSIRSEAVNLRALILRQDQTLSEVDHAFVVDAEKPLRRVTLTMEDLLALRDRLQSLAALEIVPAPCSPEFHPEESGTNGQIVRHIESNKIDSKKEDIDKTDTSDELQLCMTYEECKEVQSYATRNPASVYEMKAMILNVMHWIGCSKILSSELITKAGWTKTLKALERTLPRLSEVKHIGAYLKAATLPAGKVVTPT